MEEHAHAAQILSPQDSHGKDVTHAVTLHRIEDVQVSKPSVKYEVRKVVTIDTQNGREEDAASPLAFALIFFEADPAESTLCRGFPSRVLYIHSRSSFGGSPVRFHQ